MVFFKSFKKNTLTLLDRLSDDEEDGTTIEVRQPLSGPHSQDVERAYNLHLPLWSESISKEVTNFTTSKDAPSKILPDVLLLKSSHHDVLLEKPEFRLLSTRVRTNDVQWGAVFKTLGESSFIDGFWEWLEDAMSRNVACLKEARIYNAVYVSLFSYDRHAPVIRAFCEFWCPTTNTLHTSLGELSISLWDLHELGGLPILGSIYDEVVPCVEELTGKSSTGKSLPRSCQHLFSAYREILHTLNAKPPVKISSWINYWYKGDIKYTKPPSKAARNKAQAPKETHQRPSGKIGAASKRTSKELTVFDELDIAKDDIEETYLAAFLACWLCKFVFPGSDCSIRPGVFKAACKMAQGHPISLAIPVLANLYHGLSKIVCSADPGASAVVLPYHYLYGWLGEYFGTHFTRSGPPFLGMAIYSGSRSAKRLEEYQAQELFTSSRGERWDKLAWYQDSRRELVDDKCIGYENAEYFASLRSSFLSCRRDRHLILQPYSPHRFSRQFGFHQHVPGQLRENPPSDSLCALFQHWKSIIDYSGSRIFLPGRNNLSRYTITREYATWWSKFSSLHTSKTSKRIIISLPNPSRRTERICDMKGAPASTEPMAQEDSEKTYVRGSTEGSSGGIVHQTRGSPYGKRTRSYAALEEDDISDSNEVIGDFLERRGPNLPNPREQDGSSRDDSDRHPKRRRIESRDVFYEGNTSFSLDPSNFFDGVPAASQSLHPNEGVSDDHMTEADCSDIENCVDGYLSPHSSIVPKELPSVQVAPVSPSIVEFTSDDLSILTATGLLGVQPASVLTAPPSCDDATLLTTSASLGEVDVEKIIRKSQLQAASVIGGFIQEIILNNSFEDILLVKGKLEALLSAASQTGVDPSSLKEKVEEYVRKVTHLISMQSACSNKVAPEVQKQLWSIAETNLTGAVALENALTKHRESLQVAMTTAESRRDVLRKELSQLDTTIEHLQGLISDNDVKISQEHSNVSRMRAEQDAIMKASVLSTTEIGTMKALREQLEVQRTSFKDFNWLR